MTDAQRQSFSPEDMVVIRRWYACIGSGYRGLSRDKLSMMAKLGNTAKWRLRKLRYGPTGNKRDDYGKWRADHNYPPIEPQSSELNEKPGL